MRCGHGSESVGDPGADVDGSEFRRSGHAGTACVCRGRFKESKSKASKAPVPMHPLLAGFLLAWRKKSTYSAEGNFVLGGGTFRKSRNCFEMWWPGTELNRCSAPLQTRHKG